MMFCLPFFSGLSLQSQAPSSLLLCFLGNPASPLQEKKGSGLGHHLADVCISGLKVQRKRVAEEGGGKGKRAAEETRAGRDFRFLTGELWLTHQL